MLAPPQSPFTSDWPEGLGVARLISLCSVLRDVAMDDHTVDDAVVLGFLRGHEVVALHVFRDLLDFLSRVLGHDLLESPLEGNRLTGMDLVCRLLLEKKKTTTSSISTSLYSGSQNVREVEPHTPSTAVE